VTYSNTTTLVGKDVAAIVLSRFGEASISLFNERPLQNIRALDFKELCRGVF
jgi:hypothetical protein